MAWYTPWKRWQRIKITVPSGTTEAQSYFQVYIPASSLPAELTNNTYGRSDGGDLAFAADLGIGDVAASIGDRVPCEVVSASFGASPSAEIHVRIPTLAATGTLSYLWVGYSNADQTAQPAADSTYGSQNVWKEGGSQNYAGVWHFGTPSVFSAEDSTANGNHGVNHGVTSAAGIVGGAGLFDATPEYVTTPVYSVKNTGAASTWMWGKAGTAGVIMAQSYLPSLGFLDPGLSTSTYSQDSCNLYFYSLRDYVQATAISLETWHLVSGVWDASGKHLYLDGVLAGESLGFTPIPENPWEIGDFWYGSFHRFQFYGMIDEPRISSVARSASWIAAEFANQKYPGTFLTLSGSPLSTGNRRRRLLICGARR